MIQKVRDSSLIWSFEPTNIRNGRKRLESVTREKGQEEIDLLWRFAHAANACWFGSDAFPGAQWPKTRPHNVLYFKHTLEKIFRVGPTNIICQCPSHILCSLCWAWANQLFVVKGSVATFNFFARWRGIDLIHGLISVRTSSRSRFALRSFHFSTHHSNQS